MRVSVICERCGHIIDLVPETLGKLAYVNNKFTKNDDFKIFELTYNPEISLSHPEEFIESLLEADDEEIIKNILEEDLSRNVDIESNLQTLRIDCGNCGDYIVLTQFE